MENQIKYWSFLGTNAKWPLIQFTGRFQDFLLISTKKREFSELLSPIIEGDTRGTLNSKKALFTGLFAYIS